MRWTPSGGRAGGQAGSSSAADATAIIAARCGSCHSADAATYYHASSAAEAQALIDQMIQQGPVVTPDEERALVKYFTRD